ncbi:hypothetical protein [Nonomuraea angiospora]|uniref:hypothetical protein n=1 Tax=Nonomuraea angiospora TaxID=46172 RepID=UPI0029A5AAB6|nr:hypothetical protein [Nonomuraea angiospora]MDX3103513.1 hypothetical protein [Nonomuraea angiospora]
MKIGAAAPALLVMTSAVIRTATRLPVRFTVTMLCDPGKPMLVLRDDEELAQCKYRQLLRHDETWEPLWKGST